MDNKTRPGLWWIAWRSFRRLGIAPMVFLTLGMGFFLVFTIRFMNLRAEKTKPLLLSARNSQITAQEMRVISEQPEVSMVSAVYEISAPICIEEALLDLSLYGIESGFLENMKQELISGVIYPDSTAMPYLVLNEAACMEILKLFDKEDLEQWDSMEPDKLHISIQIGEKLCPGAICGVVKDGLEISAAYLSVEAAGNLLEAGTSCQQVWLWLDHSENIDQVIYFLAERGYTVESDYAEQEMARLAAQNLMMGFFLSSMIAFAASAALLHLGISADRKWNSEEYEHLGVIFASDGFLIWKLNFRRILIQTGICIPAGLLLGLLLTYFYSS